MRPQLPALRGRRPTAAAERPPGTASSAHSKTSRALRPKTQPQDKLTMLRGAGLGVAMGNALPEVHAEADVVIDDHRGDAIARLIEDRLLP